MNASWSHVWWNLISHQISEVETYTKLFNHRCISYYLQSFHKCLCSGFGDGAKVLHQVRLGHPNASVVILTWNQVKSDPSLSWAIRDLLEICDGSCLRHYSSWRWFLSRRFLCWSRKCWWSSSSWALSACTKVKVLVSLLSMVSSSGIRGIFSWCCFMVQLNSPNVHESWCFELQFWSFILYGQKGQTRIKFFAKEIILHRWGRLYISEN